MTKKKFVEEAPAKPVKKVVKRATASSLDARTALLSDWMSLSREVKTMGEDEAWALIQAEREGACRPNVILRLHGRYNRVRGQREKQECMKPIRS